MASQLGSGNWMGTRVNGTKIIFKAFNTEEEAIDYEQQ